MWFLQKVKGGSESCFEEFRIITGFMADFGQNLDAFECKIVKLSDVAKLRRKESRARIGTGTVGEITLECFEGPWSGQ